MADKSGEGLGGGLAALISPLLDVVRPSTRILGQEAGDRLKRWIDRRRFERDEGNLRGHLERNRAALEEAKDSGQNLDEMLLLPEWIEGVQKVDPDNEPLSAAWDAVLHRILSGDALALALMERITLLSTTEAALLLKFKDRHWRWDRSVLGVSDLLALEAKGLVFRLPVVPFWLGTVVLMALVYGLAPLVGYGLPQEGGAGFLFLVLFTALLLLARPVYCLSPLGAELLDRAPSGRLNDREKLGGLGHGRS